MRIFFSLLCWENSTSPNLDFPTSSTFQNPSFFSGPLSPPNCHPDRSGSVRAPRPALSSRLPATGGTGASRFFLSHPFLVPYPELSSRPQRPGSRASPALSSRPERPDFPFAPDCGASGRAVEGSRQPLCRSACFSSIEFSSSCSFPSSRLPAAGGAAAAWVCFGVRRLAAAFWRVGPRSGAIPPQPRISR